MAEINNISNITTLANLEVPLVFFDKARQALQEAHSIDEVKKIRDQAEAIRAYIKQQKGSLIMQNQAAEIKIRAELCEFTKSDSFLYRQNWKEFENSNCRNG